MSCKILKKSNKEFVFTKESEQQYEYLSNRYPTKQALLLPTLWLVQNQEGYISQEAIEYIANRLSLSSMYVYSVMSFYAMYTTQKKGTHNIKVCKSISCMLRGSEELVEYLEQRLGMRVDDDSKRFSLSETECLGHCELAPTIAINDEFFTSLDIQALTKIMDEICK